MALSGDKRWFYIVILSNGNVYSIPGDTATSNYVYSDSLGIFFGENNGYSVATNYTVVT